jgi:bifunctional DNA-binding transcriptional regulator/antitoxin component of YhaV-PrlF toxin-antitoxin module
MSATAVREKRQITLPEDVCQAVGLEIGDQVDWDVENGAIRGRKLVPETVDILDSKDVDPKTLLPRTGEITLKSIVKAVHEARERGK